MSNTHDFDIENANGANFRSNLNNALDDIQSTNSGASEPTTKVAYKLWIDTSNNKVKLRNGSNNAWVELGSTGAEMGHATVASPSFTGTVTSAGDIVCNSNGRIKLPVGTTGQRPGSPATGDTRYNTTIAATETYTGSAWSQLGGAPTGAVFAMAHSTVPSGYLECNGAAVSRSSYANLFAVLGTTYGNGNHSSTFNLPDLRGEFIRGWDNGRGVDSGRDFGSTQSDQNKQHNHGVNDPGHGHTINYTNSDHQDGESNESGDGGTAGTHNVNSNTTGISINNDGGSEVRVRNIAMMYVIRY